MGMGLMMVFVYLFFVNRSMGVLLLGSVFAFNLVVETVRLRVPSLNDRVVRLWGPLMRSCEVDRYTGTPYYIAAAIIAIGIFPKPIAVLAIAFLAVGDPIASFFGILYGDRSVRFSNGKSLIGTAAGCLACFGVGLFLLHGMNDWFAMHLSSNQIWSLAVIGALAGGGAELLPMEVDDNFAIPVVSGFALWIAVMILGVPFYG